MTRSKTITLLGPTARGRFRFTLGVYEQQREWVNGHPHFLKRGQEDVAMWHTEDGWIVGEVSMMGESRGLLHNMCDAALPQDVHARCVWLINTITDWIPSPHIRCVQGDAHEELKALAAAELAEVNSGAEHVSSHNSLETRTRGRKEAEETRKIVLRSRTRGEREETASAKQVRSFLQTSTVGIPKAKQSYNSEYVTIQRS